ncbi:MAG TPA: hypothetical protein PKY01_14980 [Candidatus Hydrogenedentes bacterium]|nr:hypothetical protein [Candidatus Hydrogenedentota bacterium]
MSGNPEVISWDEIEPLISRFTVWVDSPELVWFAKAWRGLAAAGLTAYSNEEEKHWVCIRAVALGIMYGEYCYLEWEQYCDPPSCIYELYHDEEMSHVRIGNMADREFETNEAEDMELFCLAVLDLVSQVRIEVYDAICKEFGDPTTLYAGLYASREEDNDQENLEAVVNEVFALSDSPIGSEHAYHYVISGMFGVDA